MLNYEIDPAVLRPRVPPGTELDSWGGVCYVSMVGFLFLDTRVLGLPIPGHRNFEEVNLRFYVRRRADGEWRRGVVFVKEIVPSRAIAAVARGLYDENYQAMPMSHLLDGNRVGYRWGQSNHLSVETAGELGLAAAGSLEEFITEHYWGYSRRLEYQVEHPPWRLWQTSHAELSCDAAKLYGPEFADALSCAPRSAFVAEGSRVVVRWGTLIACPH
jgi:uncharacterized protein YqjF (DUF2071 family)